MSEKIAVISGAADGIGWAMARVFAQNGQTVVLTDRDGERAQERVRSMGGSHVALAADITSEGDVGNLAAQVSERFGRVDTLINNAGISDSHLPSIEQDMDHFGKVIDVHIKGTFLMSRVFGATMIAQGHGTIVNVGSIAGVSGMPRRNAYGAAKAGILSLTRAMACEWAGQGVRVNAIVPGYVETGLVKALAGDGRIDIERISRRIPLGFLAAPEDIANAALFLSSPQARYITGTTLAVDGGWSAFGDFGDASTGRQGVVQ